MIRINKQDIIIINNQPYFLVGNNWAVGYSYKITDNYLVVYSYQLCKQMPLYYCKVM